MAGNRVAVGFCDAYSKTLVVAGESPMGTTGAWQFLTGFQGNATYLGMIMSW